MAALLNRVKEPEINPIDAWAHDPFNRRQEGETLSKLIATSTDEPLVISLQSPWGSGKTIFLRRIAAHLQAELCVPVIRIDAWKSDDAEDPLETIVSEITCELDRRSKKNSRVAKRVDTAISSLASYGSRVILPAASFVADALAPGTGALARTGSDYGKELLKNQEEKRKASRTFRSALEQSRDLLTGRAKDRPMRPMVLIIDELDRCRPDHAIRMLERIKHHFDIPGITFVIATDHGNLPSAVKTVYGQHVDGELYLRKFFDYEFHLRAPSIDAYSELLVREHLFPGSSPLEHIDRYKNIYFHELRASSLDITADLNAFEYSTYFALYSNVFQLSLRDQSQAMTILSAFIRTRKNGEITFPQVDSLIACLRFGSPQRFRKYLTTGRVFLTSAGAGEADAESINRLTNLKLHAPANEFLKLRFDGSGHDDAVLKNIEKIATSGRLDEIEALAASLMLIRLSKLKSGGKGYITRIARLAEALSD